MNEVDEQYLLSLSLRDAKANRMVFYKNGRLNETVAVSDFIESGGMTLPEDQKPMTATQFGKMAADVPAGLVKGAIQGTVGLPGDIESIIYGVREIINSKAGEDKLDAFVRGIEQETFLPTTENVKTWLDKNIGTLIPKTEKDESRKKAGGVSEFVGELGGAGKTIKEATKAVAKRRKAVTAGATTAIPKAEKQDEQ